MAHITLNDPVVNQPDSSEEPKIPADFDIIANMINGGLDATNLSTTFLNSLLTGLSGGPHQFATGGASFTGANAIYSGVVTVPHGLGAPPIYVACMPALVNTGSSDNWWAAAPGLSAAANSTDFFVEWLGFVNFTSGWVFDFNWLAIS